MRTPYYLETYPDSCGPYARPFDLLVRDAPQHPTAQEMDTLRRALLLLGMAFIGGNPLSICLDVDAFPPQNFHGGPLSLQNLGAAHNRISTEIYRQAYHKGRAGESLSYILEQAVRLDRGAREDSFDIPALTAAFKDIWAADPLIDARLVAAELIFRDTARDPADSLWLEDLPARAPLVSASLDLLRQRPFAHRVAKMFLVSRFQQHITAPEDVLMDLVDQSMRAVTHGQDHKAVALLLQAGRAPLRKIADNISELWPQMSSLADMFLDRTIRVRHAKGLIASLPAIVSDCKRIQNGTWVASLSDVVAQKRRAALQVVARPGEQTAVDPT